MQIKKKTLGRAEWYTDTQRSVKYKYVKDDLFEGSVGVLSFTGLEEPDMVPTSDGNLCVADNGYHWIELIPKDSNWVLTAMLNLEQELFQCYFDVTAKNEIFEDGNAVFYDAFLDVVYTPNGRIEILDGNELDEALAEGVISQQEYQLYKKVAADIVAGIRENSDKLQACIKKMYFDFMTCMA